MKTLLFGNIHCMTFWKDILEREKPDRVIFLGDYVSTHERITAEQQIENMDAILKLKESSVPNVDPEIILLRGNHDIQHLTHDTSTCAYFPEVGNWMCENKTRFMNNTQWLFEDENGIIYSHAGVSETWMNHNDFETLDEINECSHFMFFEFTPCKISDYYGDSETQPPTWIRPSTLLSCGLKDKTFVVGHTAYKFGIADLYEKTRELFPEVFETFKDRNVHIWTCDALPRQYLVVEDGQFIVKKNYTDDPTTW